MKRVVDDPPVTLITRYAKAAISPVDPPGQTLSEPSVAVVDDYNFSIVHPDRLPAGTERRGAFPGAH